MMIDIGSDGKKVKKGFFAKQKKPERRANKKRKKTNQINNLGVVFWVVGENRLHSVKDSKINI